MKKFYSWFNEPTQEIQQQFEAAEKNRKMKAKDYDPREAQKTNPGAIYYSRALSPISQSRSSMKSMQNVFDKLTHFEDLLKRPLLSSCYYDKRQSFQY